MWELGWMWEVRNSIRGMIPSEDETEYLVFLILFLIFWDKIHIT